MSSVRMCDKCGRVFSENEENWSTGHGSQFFTENGKRMSREVQEDRCGECNGTPQAVKPNLGMLTANSRIDALEKDEIFARLQNLEADKVVNGTVVE